jgi:hypothetical protein
LGVHSGRLGLCLLQSGRTPPSTPQTHWQMSMAAPCMMAPRALAISSGVHCRSRCTAPGSPSAGKWAAQPGRARGSGGHWTGQAAASGVWVACWLLAASAPPWWLLPLVLGPSLLLVPSFGGRVRSRSRSKDKTLSTRAG